MPKLLPGEAPAPPPTETTTDRMDPSVQATLPRENPRTPSVQFNASPPGQGKVEVAIAQAGLAGKLEVSSLRTNQMYSWIDPYVVKTAPHTMAYYTTANQDESMAQAMNDSLSFFGTLYGDQAMGSFVKTFLIQDPVSAQRTRDLIGDLVGMDPAKYSPMTGGRLDPGDAPGNLETILADPANMQEAFKRLTPAEQLGVQNLATSLQQALATGSDLSTDLFNRTVAVAKDGYQTVLGPDERRALDDLVKIAGTGIGGTTAGVEDLSTALEAQATGLGIVQIRRQGGGVIVLDEADAKANPDTALAIKEYLEAEYPEATIQIGPQGVVASMIEKLGLPIDYISAPIGAVLHQGTEALQKLTSDGDPTETLKAVQLAKQQIQEVGVAPKWVRDAMTAGVDFGDPNDPADVQRFLDHMAEQNTFDLGPDTLWDDLKLNTRPEQMGFGLGDTFTQAAGLLPGDPGYEAARIGIGIVANIALDPINYVGPIVGGVRAASRIPLVGEEALQVTNGWIKQMTYMKLARTPEEFVQTKTYINTVKKLWTIREQAGSADAFATVLVQKTGLNLERAREMALATNEADMSIALMADSMGIRQVGTLDDVFGVINKRNALALRAGTSAEDVSDVAQLKFYDSVIEGSDLVKPYDSMPTFRQLNRLQKAVEAPPTGIHRAILAAEDTVKRFPSSLIPRSSRSLRKLMEDPDLVARKSITRSFGEFRNLWKDPGFGGRIVLEDATEFSTFTGIREARDALATATKAGDLEAVKAAESQLASAELNMVNAVDSGLKDLGDAARLMGVSDKRFRALLEPFVAGTLTDDIPGQYRWIKDTWRALVDESPKLSGLAKSDLRDLMNTAVQDRIGSLITHADGTYSGTLTRHIPGQALPYVTPSLSAEMARSIPLPSLQHFRELATNTGRTMTYWKTLGGPRRAISSTHGWLAKLWQQGNSIWRSWVLGSRLLFGLPARIIGEQQIRMAGFEYNSAVWHPLEWWRSTKWSGGDAWLEAGSPEAALGTMIDSIAPHWGSMGRHIVTVDDGSPFFRTYSSEVAKYFRSPEVKQWRFVDGEIQVPGQMIARMRDAGPKGQAWMRHLESTVKPGQTVDEAVDVATRNLVTDMEQLIGRGPGAQTIRDALRAGHVSVNGEDFFVGTDRFAEMLGRMVDDGEWMPGKLHLPRETGTLLDGDQRHLAAEFRDKAFSMFYSRPDLATSRVPLYHQVYEREFNNLIKLGYNRERAIEVARSVAAGQTADMMFTIGAHTSGEMLLRTIMPFFPAYRELGTTWLYRIPARIGQLQESRFALLGWGLGATVLTRRAAIIMDGLEQAGVIRQDAQGQWLIGVGGLGGLLNYVTGANTNWKVDISLQSIAGILPVPFGLNQTDSEGNPLPWNERLRGTLPTLGGMSVGAMALMKSKLPNIIGPVEDWSTMFGSDTSFGPHSLDMIWQAVSGLHGNGEPAPWVLGRTRQVAEATQQFAITDGMRLAMNEIPAPVYRDDFTLEEEQAYTKAVAEYVSEIASRGQRYATGIYFLKAGIGSALPFSVGISDEVREDYGKTWEFLNRLPGGSSGALASGVYRSVLAQHPEMAVYAVPKSLDMRDVDDPDRSIKAYFNGIAEGKIVPPDEREWALFAMGSVSRTLHYATLGRIRRESGETYGERLMNRDAADALDAENESWRTFMTWSELNTKELGYKQSLADMFNTYDKYRTAKGDVPQITSSQQALIEFDRDMNKYDQYFDYNFETAGQYNKMKTDAYEALTSAYPQSEEARAKGWYFNNVQDKYYSKRDELYASLHDTKDASLVFSEIRQLSDRFNHDWTNGKHPDWGQFPSPEAYSFAQKSDQDQRRLLAQWAANPADWLTRFQREQVGYDIPEPQQKAVSKWADYQATLEHQLRVYEENNQISSSSNEHEANKALLETLLATRAKKLGIDKTIQQFDTPTYQRVGQALDLTNHTNTIQIDPDIVPAGHMNSWEYVAHLTKWANQYLNSVEIDPQGDNAKPTQELFAKLVNDAREQDDALDSALNEIGEAVGETNVYSLYRYLFFDVTFNP